MRFRNRRAASWHFALLLCIASASSAAPGPWTLQSPDGTLTVDIKQAALSAPYPTSSNLYYSVRRGAQTVVEDSPLGITLPDVDGNLSDNLTPIEQTSAKVKEDYTLIGGKFRHCSNRANEKTLTFKNATGRLVRVIFRAYDDGIAYRYQLPGTGATTITGESSGFHIPLGAKGWLAASRPDYEEYYPEGHVGQDFKSGDFAIPATFDVGGGQFVLLCESDVGASYCASRLTGSPDGIFRIKFADPNVPGTLPWVTPWRIIITGTLPQVVESNLVTDLARPAITGDTSWIKPGRVAWSWWGDGTGDLALQKKYVDFAQAMGWEYVLVDEGWRDWNNKNPGPQVTELVNYGRAHNVGIILWSHYHDLDTPAQRDASLPLWKSWGIKGVKIDFFNSDSKSIMQEREDILQATWQNQLMVNFHGDQSPRGQNRAWPHFLTREGVRGAEYYKFGPYPNPTYNCTLPYTRNVLGPMDYTPVTFSTKNRKTTSAHELALSVLYQSGWLHLADTAATYSSLPVGRDFLKQVPADWDEMRFLGGYPAQWTCIARRKGDAWFIGMNNAGTARTLHVPLGFLSRGNYELDLYKDGAVADSISYTQSTVKARDAIDISVPSNGGFAARLVPVR